MKKEALLNLTDGNGNLYTGEIVSDHKKSTVVKITAHHFIPKTKKEITIAISLIKNNSRLEWFLEKAAELGVTTIIPLLCERTEKQHFRFDRMQNILTSAMLQSQQSWLTHLVSPTDFSKALKMIRSAVKLIAHCLPEEKKELLNQVSGASDAAILIGPEGDFTNSEIEQAIKASFIPVSLGDTRLRTETAGIVAATIMKLA
jgi:16S rRNA (uracil1498-N3)-methyltransferase